MEINRKKFSLDAMTEKLTEIMDGVVDKVPQQVGITLPKLKKTTKATPPPIPNLPKLKKLTKEAVNG